MLSSVDLVRALGVRKLLAKLELYERTCGAAIMYVPDQKLARLILVSISHQFFPGASAEAIDAAVESFFDNGD